MNTNETLLHRRRFSTGEWGDQAHTLLRFEFLLLAALVSLAYKLDVLGVITLVAISSTLLIFRKRVESIGRGPIVFCTLYVAMATVTAFRVDFSAGLSRTLQFTIVMLSAMATAKYLYLLNEERRWKFFKRLVLLLLLILAHVIAYHVSIGKYNTWKYLYDTKMVFSLLIVALFSFEDEIRSKGIAVWILTAISVAGVTLLSGERKAYLLFALALVFSRASGANKALGGAVIVAGLFLFTLLTPGDSYVARQLASLVSAEPMTPTRHFFTVQGIADHSDLVRRFVNRNADRLFDQNPLTGVGSTGYQEWSRRTYGTLSQSGGLSMNVHGERHRVPAESGILGIGIAIGLVLSVALAVVKFLIHNGGFKASSRARAPLYLFCLALCYMYSEALDTTMLLLIALIGLMAGLINGKSEATGLQVGRGREWLNSRLTRIS